MGPHLSSLLMVWKSRTRWLRSPDTCIKTQTKFLAAVFRTPQFWACSHLGSEPVGETVPFSLALCSSACQININKSLKIRPWAETFFRQKDEELYLLWTNQRVIIDSTSETSYLFPNKRRLCCFWLGKVLWFLAKSILKKKKEQELVRRSDR